MIIRIIKKRPLLAIIPFLQTENPYDYVDKPVNAEPDTSTGFQRLKRLFEPYEDYAIHPKVANIMINSIGGFIMGGMYGGCTASRYTFIEFIENNEATKFLSHMEAKRQLSDKMFLSFARGGLKWGTRIGLFCTTFTTGYTVISVYRDKNSFVNYIVGGMFAGGTYKFNLGPKGMISGAFFGGFFGGIYGGLKSLLLTLSRITEEELTRQKYELTTKRADAIRDSKKYILMEQEKKLLQEAMTSK